MGGLAGPGAPGVKARDPGRPNGADLAITMDLRTDRLNYMVFDGVVVAAALDTE